MDFGEEKGGRMREERFFLLKNLQWRGRELPGKTVKELTFFRRIV